MVSLVNLMSDIITAAYCVVANESAGRQTPIAFLERVKEDFSKKYAAKAANAAAHSLNGQYKYSLSPLNSLLLFVKVVNYDFFCFDKNVRSKLKEHMRYCADHPEEINKIAKVKAQVSEVKGVMMENIEKVFFFISF